MKKSVNSPFTIAGILFAILGPLVFLKIARSLAPSPYTNLYVAGRELCFFLMAAILILIIIKGEKLPLSSVGLNTRTWGKSLIRVLIIMVTLILALVACISILKLFGIEYGSNDNKYSSVSLWLISFTMIRAGIVEELFYRGYLMERLFLLKKHWTVFLFLPSLIFGFMHYSQGFSGMLVAFVSGIIMSLFYWKSRDLKSNIMAHFLIDFIPNVILPLLGG